MKAGQLRDFVRAKGLQSYLVQGDLVDLQRELERERPVIVGIAKKYGPKQVGHYEVVVGINRQMQKIVTIDPGAGWSEDSFQGFLAEWLPAQRLTLIVSPVADQELSRREDVQRRYQVSESIEAIARAHNRSPKAIQMRLERLGVAPRSGR